MGKEVVNRRENLLSGSIPPEIPDVSGFLTATDYATDTTGGVIKVDSTYALELTSGGKLKGKEIASDNYSEANSGALISKATLDNVLAGYSTGGVTVDVLFFGAITKGGTEHTFQHPYTDYKLLSFGTFNSTTQTYTAGGVMPVRSILTGTNNLNYILYASASSANVLGLRFNSEDATKFTAPSGSGTVADMVIFGIK